MDKLPNIYISAPELAKSPSVRFFAFTNNEHFSAHGWEVVLKDFGLQYNRFITQSRWPKFQAHHEPIIQQQCTVVFYIDGNVVPKNSLQNFQEEARRILASESQLSQRKHQDNPTPEEEFQRILRGSKDIQPNVEKSLEWLHAQPDYSSDCQMYGNSNFGYAVNSKAYRQTADFFWSHYAKEEDSWRDQPLWCYSLHHTKTVPLDIPMEDLFAIERKRNGMGGHKYNGNALNSALAAAKRIQRRKEGKMNLLCTANSPQFVLGSHKLRCEDFAKWTAKCAHGVNMTSGIAYDELQATIPKTEWDFDATVFTKSVPRGSRTFGGAQGLGKIFVDMVDEYTMKDGTISTDFTVILQTLWEKERFRRHKHAVVEHWYNSYPADMELGDADPEIVPIVSNDTDKPLRFGTVWFVVDSDEGNCPSTNGINDVSYDCLVRSFNIEEWYSSTMNTTEAAQEVEAIMADPMLGRGKLYFNLFQKYDVLVALAKNHRKKLRYGNVQRIVSQFRSGVPVLVEVRGEVLRHFMDKYNYMCAFERDYSGKASNYSSSLWTFEEAVQHMKDPAVRRECQRQGLEIAKDYSPNAIGKKFLKALGYAGEFQC
ncbi:MAG: hypothetical protein SGILL_007227 [Bacillariaceae sp.]